MVLLDSAGSIRTVIKEFPPNRHPLPSSDGQFKLQTLDLIANIDKSAINTSQKNQKQKLKLLQADQWLGMGRYMLNLKIYCTLVHTSMNMSLSISRPDVKSMTLFTTVFMPMTGVQAHVHVHIRVCGPMSVPKSLSTLEPSGYK
jgi:hypothetical protein